LIQKFLLEGSVPLSSLKLFHINVIVITLRFAPRQFIVGGIHVETNEPLTVTLFSILFQQVRGRFGSDQQYWYFLQFKQLLKIFKSNPVGLSSIFCFNH